MGFELSERQHDGFFFSSKTLTSGMDRMLTHFLVKLFLRLLILFFLKCTANIFTLVKIKTRDLFKRLKKDTQFSLGV